MSIGGRHIAGERGAFIVYPLMPMAPKRPCSQPGCPELVQHGRCASHARIVEQRRGNSTKRGYGSAHKALRIQCFERDEWRCVACSWEPKIVQEFKFCGLDAPTDKILDQLRVAFGRNERHLHADHIQRIEVRPDLASDLSNMQTLCNSCHSVKTLAETNGRAYAVSPVHVAPKS